MAKKQQDQIHSSDEKVSF